MMKPRVYTRNISKAKYMKKVLVTGAGGFIGSHLSERLTELGYNVAGFVRYNSKNSWGWLENSEYKNDIEIISGDIRDYDAVSRALNKCDIVFHLAALIGIPYSYVSPMAYIKTNIEGTYNVLEAARTCGTENILITSTSETYGTAQYIPIDEKHPNVGQSPYSASKIAADQLAISYHRSFDLPVKIVRPFNTYGPRQSARAIIPAVIIQLLNAQKELKAGNLTPTRDLTFVEDTVAGFIEIMKSDNLVGDAINIGMNNEISIYDLIMLISSQMNCDIKIISDEQRIRPEKSEVERLLCNHSKLIANTSWKPKYDIQSGIRKTIEWMKEHVDLYKNEVYNI